MVIAFLNLGRVGLLSLEEKVENLLKKISRFKFNSSWLISARGTADFLTKKYFSSILSPVIDRGLDFLSRILPVIIKKGTLFGNKFNSFIAALAGNNSISGRDIRHNIFTDSECCFEA